MEQLFSDRDCLEEMLFTPLHRIVLGLNLAPLEQELSGHPLSINTVDARGRTALSWAAQRGMVETVKTLLQHGADPNICSLQGHSPLHYAAEAQNPGCLQPLLDYGAEVDQCDVDGQRALHYARHRDDVAYYRPLIEANSDPNKPDRWGHTPLTTLIVQGFSAPLEYLIDNGADVNLKGYEQRSPAFVAVEYNNHVALNILRQKGADLTTFSANHPTIAHIAAHHAHVECLRLLAGFRLRLSDIDCVDAEGLTIPQIVDKRLQKGVDDEAGFIEAFRAFLESIDIGDAALAAPTDDVEEEHEFHDALEAVVESG